MPDVLADIIATQRPPEPPPRPPEPKPAPRANGVRRSPREGVHPHAAQGVANELDRLDRLARPWVDGAGWDTTTYEVACNLIEIGNSPWSGYTIADAERDLYARAPANSAWGSREHQRKWASASKKVGGQGRPEPPPLERVNDLNDWIADQGAPQANGRADDPSTGSEAATGDVESPGDAAAALDRMRAALLDTDELDSIPEPDPLVEGLLYDKSLVWIVGKAGHGKSFLAIDFAGSVGTGQSWHGHDVIQGRVLYVAAEGATGMRKRIRAWEAHHDRKMTGVTWLPLAVQVHHADWDILIQLAEEIGATFIVLDTQARITVGMEENSAMDMGKFVHKLEQLRASTGACVGVVHHQGRNGDHMRGSTAMDGAADTVIAVSKDDDVITVKNTKQKNAEEHEDIELVLTPAGESVVPTLAAGRAGGDHPQAIRTARRWWELFGDDKVSATKVVDAEVCTKPTFYRHVAVLLKRDMVTKKTVGNNAYFRLTGDPDGE